MKRDWDVIREVLVEVEAISNAARNRISYSVADGQDDASAIKAEHALLLWEAGFLEGIDGSTKGDDCIIAPKLTWKGHELLDTIRSQAVWERVKTTAKEKGIELTFDAVKALGKAALDLIITAT